MKSSQTIRKPFLAVLLSTLLLAPVIPASPIVLPVGNNFPVLPRPPGRDWRKPHTPLGLMKGGKRPPLAPPEIVIGEPKHGATSAMEIEATSPEGHTDIYLSYLKSQKDDAGKRAVIIQEDPTTFRNADFEAGSDNAEHTERFLAYIESQKDGPRKRAVMIPEAGRLSRSVFFSPVRYCCCSILTRVFLSDEAHRKHEYRVMIDYLKAQSKLVDLRMNETKRALDYVDSQSADSTKRDAGIDEDSKFSTRPVSHGCQD